jgi:hypothetical protein
MTQRSILLVFILVAISSITQAQIVDNVITIDEVSSSGKSVYINKGSIGKIGDNDYGVLLKKTTLSEHDSRIVFKPVAKLRAVKVYDHFSVWVVFKTYISSEITKGNKLLLFSESELLQGRSDLSYKRTKLITKDGRAQEVKDFLLEGDELSKKEKDYKIISTAHKREKHFDKDIDLIDIDKWEQADGDKLFASGIYRSPHAKDFGERKRVHTFEKMVVSFLNKYNDPTFNYKDLYNLNSEGRADLGMSDTIYGSYLDKYQNNVQDKADKEEKYFSELQKKGESWSAEYSDTELSEMLNNISIVKERERRRTLVSFKYDKQIYASAGLNLISNENINDSTTTEQNKYDIEIGYETFLFKKIQSLKSFTFQASARRAQDSYYGGTLNVAQTEYSFAGHLNWYPFYNPTVVDANIVFFGALFRYGLATARNDATNETGNYQIFTLPGFRTGIKYNFKNSIGIRLVGSYESIRSERIIKSVDSGTLPDRAFYKEAKISFGISRFY